jgi:hypothetical protein
MVREAVHADTHIVAHRTVDAWRQLHKVPLEGDNPRNNGARYVNELFPSEEGYLPMVTRRSLLRQGGLAALTATAMPIFIRDVLAQSASFDYYIGPSGSDSNPGTASQPWSITAINTKQAVYAGKRVGLLDGTYNVYSLCQAGAWNQPALRVNGGTASSPTVVQAVNARKAILTAANPSGGAYPTTQCAIIGQGYMGQPNPGNVILDGLYLTRSYQSAALFYPVQTPSGQGGATGVVIRNCEIYDISGYENDNMNGIMFYYLTGALVQNNKIHSVQASPGGDCAGILTFNCKSNVYEFNTIYDCNVGILDKNGNNGNHTYRNNYIEILGLYPVSCLQDCMGGNSGDTVTIYNNVFVGRTIWDGVDANHSPSLQAVVFYNNTCYYPHGGFPGAGVYCPTSASVKFYNNIVACAGTPGYLGMATFCKGSLAQSNYNCFQCASPSGNLLGISAPTSPGTPTLYTLSGWRQATGQDSGSIAVAQSTMFAAVAALSPTGYQTLVSSATTLGRIGGVSSGTVTAAGAWGNGATQIGCNFGPIPRPPVLSVS